MMNNQILTNEKMGGNHQYQPSVFFLFFSGSREVVVIFEKKKNRFGTKMCHMFLVKRNSATQRPSYQKNNPLEFLMK